MSKLKVVNIKCGGCEAGIIAALTGDGLNNVKVDINNQEVSFDGDIDVAKKRLRALGYPEANTAEAKSLLKKAKSYISCAIGRTKK